MAEVRRLKRHGDEVGMDPESILQKTFGRMAGMQEFDGKFLSDDFARGFLPDRAA